jgi:hypothetical protein
LIDHLIGNYQLELGREVVGLWSLTTCSEFGVPIVDEEVTLQLLGSSDLVYGDSKGEAVSYVRDMIVSGNNIDGLQQGGMTRSSLPPVNHLCPWGWVERESRSRGAGGDVER